MDNAPSNPENETSPGETSQTYNRTAPSHLLRTDRSRLRSRTLLLTAGVAFLMVAVGPAAAQNQVGDVYCNTGVETGITLVFGAVAGLGLPATGFYTGRAGLSYMRAGGNPEKKNEAKEKLVMAGLGFGIVCLALVSPELIDKVGSQMGFGFSSCVRPF